MAFYFGTHGWDEASLGSGFYPEDLPPGWRLGYYANEFPAVLVPSPQWRRLTPAQASEWLDDTPESFRFFLEVEPGDDGEPVARAAALAGRLGGFIARGGTAGLDGLSRLAPVCRAVVLAPEEIGTVGPDAVAGEFAAAGVSGAPSAAGLRALVEAMAAGDPAMALLWCEGAQAVPVLRQVRVIADLLGY